MPVIDNGDLLMCLQALERAIEYNEYLSQSETVDKDDYEEINFEYECALNRLAEIYNKERETNNKLLPLDQVIKYEFGSPS